VTVETVTRTSPLGSWTEAFQALPAAVRVQELAFLTQLDLRLDPAGPARPAVEAVLGVALPTTPCTATRAGGLDVLWLGPDEWLVVAPQGSTGLEAQLGEALAGRGAVVDVSAQRTTLALSGTKARAVLAHGCSADLHPRVSKAGTCLQTSLALTGVTLLVRDDTATDYWLLVRASFAGYLASWLLDACLEYRDDPQWQ
jgi:sarcosine oxidase, subunit gamma